MLAATIFRRVFAKLHAQAKLFRPAAARCSGCQCEMDGQMLMIRPALSHQGSRAGSRQSRSLRRQ